MIVAPGTDNILLGPMLLLQSQWCVALDRHHELPINGRSLRVSHYFLKRDEWSQPTQDPNGDIRKAVSEETRKLLNGIGGNTLIHLKYLYIAFAQSSPRPNTPRENILLRHEPAFIASGASPRGTTPVLGADRLLVPPPPSVHSHGQASSKPRGPRRDMDNLQVSIPSRARSSPSPSVKASSPGEAALRSLGAPEGSKERKVYLDYLKSSASAHLVSFPTPSEIDHQLIPVGIRRMRFKRGKRSSMGSPTSSLLSHMTLAPSPLHRPRPSPPRTSTPRTTIMTLPASGSPHRAVGRTAFSVSSELSVTLSSLRLVKGGGRENLQQLAQSPPALRKLLQPSLRHFPITRTRSPIRTSQARSPAVLRRRPLVPHL